MRFWYRGFGGVSLIEIRYVEVGEHIISSLMLFKFDWAEKKSKISFTRDIRFMGSNNMSDFDRSSLRGSNDKIVDT